GSGLERAARNCSIDRRNETVRRSLICAARSCVAKDGATTTCVLVRTSTLRGKLAAVHTRSQPRAERLRMADSGAARLRDEAPGHRRECSLLEGSGWSTTTCDCVDRRRRRVYHRTVTRTLCR